MLKGFLDQNFHLIEYFIMTRTNRLPSCHDNFTNTTSSCIIGVM